MRSASVSKLKASLSEYLRAVKGGEEVIITERDKPVASLVPIAGTGVASIHMRELVKQGLAKPGRALPESFWDLPRPGDPQGLARKAASEEREAGY